MKFSTPSKVNEITGRRREEGKKGKEGEERKGRVAKKGKGDLLTQRTGNCSDDREGGGEL